MKTKIAWLLAAALLLTLCAGCGAEKAKVDISDGGDLSGAAPTAAPVAESGQSETRETPAAEDGGGISFLSGTGTVLLTGAAAQPGPLADGDAVETGRESTAALGLNGARALALDPESRLEISIDKDWTGLRLAKGGALFAPPEGTGAGTVSLSAGDITLDLTAGAIGYIRALDDREAEVVVLSGSVEGYYAGAGITAQAGQRLRLGGEAPGHYDAQGFDLSPDAVRALREDAALCAACVLDAADLDRVLEGWYRTVEPFQWDDVQGIEVKYFDGKGRLREYLETKQSEEYAFRVSFHTCYTYTDGSAEVDCFDEFISYDYESGAMTDRGTAQFRYTMQSPDNRIESWSGWSGNGETDENGVAVNIQDGYEAKEYAPDGTLVAERPYAPA